MRKLTVLFVLMLTGCFIASSQITWPEGQLLPTFPRSAETQDLIYLNGSITTEEMYLFSSLKGIVNQTQPCIFSYEGDAFAEGPYTWLNSLGVKYIEYNANSTWSVLNKYLSEVSGLIVYDPDQPHTVNLATTIAKGKNAIIAAPSLLSRLSAAPYNLPVVEDFRGKFADSLAVYQALYDTYWPDIDKRLLIGLSPKHHKASLREYAVAIGGAVIWLDPKIAKESELLNKFLVSMPEGANYMGWWPEEEPGVTRVSAYGMTTIASDYCTNLAFHSGMPRGIKAKPMPAKPELQNKIYVAFTLSDGDNLQYVEHLMRKLWNNADRGSVPIGWTLSPAMVDAMPGALNYYHQSSTENDNLISGPSGYGYTYPNNWNSRLNLPRFITKTEEYNVQAGIRVITVWNTITGGINTTTGKAFAEYSPTLLGLTAQNTGGALSIYEGGEQSLPGMPLSCNYCTNQEAMINHINSAARNWDGNSPRFVIIQAQPWNDVTPTSFKNVMNSYGDDYVFVRPDHIFQLIREANGLSVNPGGIEGEGTGLTGTYYSDLNFETVFAQRADAGINFNWGSNSPMEGLSATSFSIKWNGEVQPRYSGEYTFYITNNNKSKVWIDGQLTIDKQSVITGTSSGTIMLEAGKKYDIVIEYATSGRNAVCKLEWASPFQSREVIPPSQLYESLLSNISGINIYPDVKAFPNPCSVNELLNIAISNYNNEDAELAMYDICGRIVHKQDIHDAKIQLDVNGFSKGIYMLTVRAKNYSKTIQCVIK